MVQTRAGRVGAKLEKRLFVLPSLAYACSLARMICFTNPCKFLSPKLASGRWIGHLECS
jgi:hypothetical protein